MTTNEAARRWSVTARHVRAMCERGLIPGAHRANGMWILPDNATRPPRRRTGPRGGLASAVKTLEARWQAATPAERAAVAARVRALIE